MMARGQSDGSLRPLTSITAKNILEKLKKTIDFKKLAITAGGTVI
jgi:hypothetical protein